MPMTSEQLLAVIDTVTEHLLKQNARSEESIEGRCLYRGPNGLKCAVGALITDDAYSEAINELSVSSDLVQDALEDSGFPVRDDPVLFKILKDLQFVHDTEEPNLWARELKRLKCAWKKAPSTKKERHRMPMTTDELLAVIDTVTEHLLKQNARSEGRDKYGKGVCLYRGPNGLKCAVGALISDDAYSETINLLPVYSNSVQDALVKSGFSVRDDPTLLEILACLQYIHDSEDPSDWRIELKNCKDSWKCRLSKEHKK